MIPSIEAAEALHKKYAPSQAAYELIHTHCLIIAGIGRDLAQRANARYREKETLRQSHNLDQQEKINDCNAGPVEPYGQDMHDRELDEDLVYLGGLIHDIGTYKILASDGTNGSPLAFDKRYIQHGLAGYELLKAEGIDESIAQFARNHTGVGLTREQVVAQHLDIPADDYMPQSLEQELVMYADNYHSKHQPPIFVSESTAAQRSARFGEENLRRWKMLVEKYGIPDLQPLSQQYGMEIE